MPVDVDINKNVVADQNMIADKKLAPTPLTDKEKRAKRASHLIKYKPGQSGNPTGHPNGYPATYSSIRAALRRSLTKEKSEEMAIALLELAIKGKNVPAYRIICEILGELKQPVNNVNLEVNDNRVIGQDILDRARQYAIGNGAVAIEATVVSSSIQPETSGSTQQTI